MMTIQCETLGEFIKVCAGLAKEGVTFDAYTDGLKVTLTGGH